MMKRITADEEFPDCLKCENTTCNCSKQCGPKHGWSGYFRTTTDDRYHFTIDKDKENRNDFKHKS